MKKSLIFLLIYLPQQIKTEITMAIKSKYSSKSEVPVELLPHYVERDGAFVLDVEGMVDRARVDALTAKLEDYRINNSALNGKLMAFAGLDPDKVAEALESQRKLLEGELLKKGDIDAVLKARLGPIEKRAIEAEARLVELQINQGAIAAATKRGLRPTAVLDLSQRARNAFKLVNGLPVAVGADGQPRPGKDGVSPMSFDEWTDSLANEAPHLFAENSGSGAAGSSTGGGGGGAVNPWSKATWNLTAQMQMMRSDPRRAEQMQMAAVR